MKPLLGDGETLATPRLLLARLQPDDVQAMQWLDEALAPRWTPEDLERVAGEGRGVAIRARDGASVGVAIVSDGPTRASAFVPFIAVEPGQRFQGLGGEAALAIEGRLRSDSLVGTLYAPVPEERGLAVYFWLRLGFRPLVQSRWPGPPLGLRGEDVPGIWLARDQR